MGWGQPRNDFTGLKDCSVSAKEPHASTKDCESPREVLRDAASGACAKSALLRRADQRRVAELPLALQGEACEEVSGSLSGSRPGGVQLPEDLGV